jgi:hypothetical protein
MPLKIINKDTTQSFSLTQQASLQLELVFNKTEHGRPWCHIGDKLFEFSQTGGEMEYLLDAEKYEVLLKLRTS